jgi:nucleoid DNA-binding protein
MSKVISKTAIISSISKNMGESVTTRLINDVIDLTVDYIGNELLNNRSVSIRYFGTFAPYKMEGGTIKSIYTGEYMSFEPKVCIKFRPHEVFKVVLSRKSRENLEKESEQLDE